MKIAIPTVQGKLSLHFGHCEKFTILDVNMETKTVDNQVALDPPMHEPGVLPRWLAQQGADIIIAGGMGSRAQNLFASQNIKVIVGAPADTPENIIKMFLEDKLVCGTNACDH